MVKIERERETEKSEDTTKKRRERERKRNSIKIKARVGIELFTSRHFVLINIIKCDIISVFFRVSLKAQINFRQNQHQQEQI